MQRAFAGRIASRLLAVVYPSSCPVCGGQSDYYAHAPFCRKCMGEIVPYKGNACSVCFKPIDSELTDTCGACLSMRPPFEKALSFGLYEGSLKEAINLLKFGGVKRLSNVLSDMVCSLGLPAADCIVPVPLSKGSLSNRGYNQSYLIARGVSNALNIQLDADCLKKIKATAPQVGMTLKQRFQNIKGAFAAQRMLSGKTVMLIDDVITTTATVSECARVLLKAGAEKVYAVSVARTRIG